MGHQFSFPLRYLFAAHPQAMGKVLGIVYRTISAHLNQKAGYLLKDGATGGVTLIQRFGSALNVNIHFHILFLDGIYVCRDDRPLRFQRVKAPYKSKLEEMTWAQRLKRAFDIEVCGHCGVSVKIITCIEDQDVIDGILAHLRQKEQSSPTLSHLVPHSRSPPEPLPLFAGKESSSTTYN